MLSRLRCGAPLSASVAIVLALAAAPGCSPTQGAAPPTRHVRIATGIESGPYNRLGRALAGIYASRIPALTASALETTGSGFNVRAVEDGQAELGFVHADSVYLAVRQGTPDRPHPYRHLRAIAVLYGSAVQIAVLRSLGVQRLSDLERRPAGDWRPGFARTPGALSSGTESAAGIILQELGLTDRVLAEPLAFDELTFRMAQREIDIGFFVSSYPNPALRKLNASSGIRLLSVPPELAIRIRTDFPFYRPIRIPAGTYEGQHAEIATIGVDNVLVCRDDLPDELVYRLTRTFFESLEALADAHDAASEIEPDDASAAPIPLHPGAARYYRERELFR